MMIDKQTQDQAWASLPTNIRESAKYYYQHTECGTYSENLLEDLFGEHNLTSDAEPEEMCVISRTNVEALHSEIHKAIMDAHDADDWQDATHYILDVLPRSFEHLFGSKFLPDLSEQKPAEPKFKCGEKVRIIKRNHPQYGKTATIDTLVKGPYPEVLVNLGGNLIAFDESDLEPYTEPGNESRNLSFYGQQEIVWNSVPDELKSKIESKYAEYNVKAFNGFAVGYCAAIRDIFGHDRFRIIK